MDAPHRRRQHADGGFTLVEIMVAFALLAVMSTALLTVVVTMQKVTREDAARVVANNIASRELEITRDTFSGVTRGPDRVATNRVVNPNPLPGGVPGQPLEVDGTAYTVTRDAQWAAVGAGDVSTCDDGSNAELAYLRVQVEVRWPELGSRPPVTMETVMTPLKGTYVATTGHAGLKVIGSDGLPRGGVAATISGRGVTRSGITSSDGCVLFSFLDPGSYVIRLGGSGDVDPTGSTTVDREVTISSGLMWRGTQEYDRAATVVAELETLDGYSLPTELVKLPTSIGNSALLPTGSRAVPGVSTSTRVIDHLWPFPSGYQLWAGGCADADPGEAGDPPVAVTPGQTSTGRVFLPALDVTLPAGGATVTATHLADSACDQVTMELGRTDTAALKTSLPFGTWRLSRPGRTDSVVVTIKPPAPTEEGVTPPPPAAIPVDLS